MLIFALILADVVALRARPRLVRVSGSALRRH